MSEPSRSDAIGYLVQGAKVEAQLQRRAEAAEREVAALRAKLDRVEAALWDHEHCIGECACAVNAVEEALTEATP